MSTNHFKPVKRVMPILLTLLLLWSATDVVKADDVPITIRRAIEEKLPGAVITEIQSGKWKGQPVTEVEVATPEGIYEVVISDQGDILNIDEEKGLPWIGGELTLGLAVRGEQSIYKGVGSEFGLTPFLVYDNGPLHITAYDKLDAVFDLYRKDAFAIGAKGSLILGEGYDPEDSDFLRGMDELGTLYSAGLDFSARVAGGEAGLEIMQDISGEHEGQHAELSYAYPWSAAGFNFRPELSVTWLSNKTVDYLFGVSAREARADRPAYSPRSSYAIEAELLVRRPIYGNFSLVGLAEITAYGKEITDSPLVEKDYEIEGAIGLGYDF